MFVASQPWHKDGDFKKMIEGLEPPPPPGAENLWELHFCKWWGWNWVKRKDGMEPEVQKYDAPRTQESKKPEKKPIKNLCHLWCKKNNKELQKMYNTPSNSVIEDRKHTIFQNSNNIASTCLTDSAKAKKCPDANTTSSQTICADDRCDRVERKSAERDRTSQTGNKKKMKRASSNTSSEECHCYCSDLKQLNSDDSIEYIKIQCCPCCHAKETPAPPPPRMPTIEKFTQGTPYQPKITATQTEQVKRKKRRICVVCCCKCGKNLPQSCCSCNKSARGGGGSGVGGRGSGVGGGGKGGGGGRKGVDASVEVFGSINEESNSRHKQRLNKDTTANLKARFKPLCMTTMPVETMLYLNKPMPKLGTPSRSYSWIHATQSDIWDQFSHLKLIQDIYNPDSKKTSTPTEDEKPSAWDKYSHLTASSEFFSPLSGKTYNLSPIKIDDIGPDPSVLLSPLSVDEELQSLKKIESDVKMDLKSRIMLDVVCDAILKKDKEPEAASSIFLNEFTYPFTLTQTESMPKSEDKLVHRSTSPHLIQASAGDRVDVGNMDKPHENMIHCEANTSKVSTNVSSLQNVSIGDYPKEEQHPSPRSTMEDRLRKLLNNDLKGNENPYKLLDCSDVNNKPLISIKEQTSFTTSKLISTTKRSASPSPQNRDSKKVKLKDPSALTPFRNSNISDIFHKIDEIVMRSKVNNDEIQNVLNNIPKRSFQFFTSWEVLNLSKSNQTLHLLEQEEPRDSPVTTVSETVKDTKSEETEDVHNTKIYQAKKKKGGGRPSLIPKRIIKPKSCKRNVL